FLYTSSPVSPDFFLFSSPATSTTEIYTLSLRDALPISRARSLIGNYSALALVAPGQFPASPKPSVKRKILSDTTDLATACSAMDTDQTTMDNKKPIRVPIMSKILPKMD